jgi:hypothetical protein
MYRIIGSDGQERGPVTAEQIRQWLAEGRIDATARVSAEGSGEWKSLSEFPELAGAAVRQAAPVNRSPASMPDRSPSDLVRGPATGLLVTAIVGVVLMVVSILLNLLGVGMGLQQTTSDAWMNVFSGTIGIIFNIIGIGIGAVIFIGAQKMKRLESYNWAMAASIIALIPCISPCCLLGLPFGIWALVVLAKPEVKNAFQPTGNL